MSGTLLTPGTLDEALAALGDHPRARLVAGGTDVIADLNRGAAPTGLVSLRSITELQGFQSDGGRTRLGAMATVSEIRADVQLASAATALGQAARSMASRQVRNRATVGGNVCGGGSYRTLVPVLLAHDARVEVAGRAGLRRVALAEMLAPGGIHLAPGEILTAVDFVPATGPERFYRIGPRNALCYATASVTVVLDEPTRSVRVALGGVAPTAVRAPAAEFVGSEGVDWLRRTVCDDVADQFGVLAAEAADPVTDLAATASYRRHAVKVMARRALRHVFETETA